MQQRLKIPENGCPVYEIIQHFMCLALYEYAKVPVLKMSRRADCFFVTITSRKTFTWIGNISIESDLFKIYSYSIGPRAKKKCKYEGTKNAITEPLSVKLP